MATDADRGSCYGKSKVIVIIIFEHCSLAQIDCMVCFWFQIQKVPKQTNKQMNDMGSKRSLEEMNNNMKMTMTSEDESKPMVRFHCYVSTALCVVRHQQMVHVPRSPPNHLVLASFLSFWWRRRKRSMLCSCFVTCLCLPVTIDKRFPQRESLSITFLPSFLHILLPLSFVFLIFPKTLLGY